MQHETEKGRDLEKEREEILKLAEASMTPELRQALILAQNLPIEPAQEVKTTFTESTNADAQ
jgi:hypothetical protein